MATHGLPNDVLSNLDPFALIIFIPLCDLLVSSLLTYHSELIPTNPGNNSSIQLSDVLVSTSALSRRLPSVSLQEP